MSTVESLLIRVAAIVVLAFLMRRRVPFKLWHPFAAGEHKRVQEWVRDNLGSK